MMQTVIIAFILAVAIGYAAWRIHQLWIKGSNPCYGCDGCTLKKQVCDKKRDEKFGESK